MTPSESPGLTAPVAVPAKGRVPDFFIVGHEKCGTTALDLMLKNHPQIFLPEAKEQRFFAPDLRDLSDPRANRTGPRPRTFERYLTVFADARPGQRVGEASPQYLRSLEAARRIAAVQPGARIIAILREPASFLRSFHLQWVRNGLESETDLRKAIRLEDKRREGKRIPRRCKVPQTLFYSDHVRYVEQLERYRAVFPAEQMLILIYDDFVRDNRAALRQVLCFLDVDDAAVIDPVRTKTGKAVRNLFLKRLADSARLARRGGARATRLGQTVNALTPEPLQTEAFRARWRRLVYKDPAPPDEDFMLELRRRFKPEVVALSEYLGRDLVGEWRYDRLD